MFCEVVGYLARGCVFLRGGGWSSDGVCHVPRRWVMLRVVPCVVACAYADVCVCVCAAACAARPLHLFTCFVFLCQVRDYYPPQHRPEGGQSTRAASCASCGRRHLRRPVAGTIHTCSYLQYFVSVTCTSTLFVVLMCLMCPPRANREPNAPC